MLILDATLHISDFSEGGKTLSGKDKASALAREAVQNVYKSKRAFGDVKIKNKPDPYAFMPFDSRTMNRRKRVKAVGEFKSTMKAAKKGVAAAKKKLGREGRSRGARR